MKIHVFRCVPRVVCNNGCGVVIPKWLLEILIGRGRRRNRDKGHRGLIPFLKF